MHLLAVYLCTVGVVINKHQSAIVIYNIGMRAAHAPIFAADTDIARTRTANSYFILHVLFIFFNSHFYALLRSHTFIEFL